MLLPPNLTDWIPNNHICFVVNDIVDNLNLDSVENTYSNNGSSAYDPRMLIKVIFYSYAKGIRSSRRIEEMAGENIVCRYLSANQCPDHGTVNLFRKNHLKNLENLFAQIVILAAGLNIADPTDIAIDGSVFKASASKKATYDQEAIAKLKQRIRKVLQEAEEIDEEEDKKFGPKRGCNEMPDKLKDPVARQKEIKRLQNKMKQLEEANKAIDEKQKQARTKAEKELSRNNTHNITDQDAKLMKMKKGRTFQPAYNGQIATSNQIIVAYDVTDDGADTNCLMPMIEKIENISKKKVKKVKADSSYFSANNLDSITEKKIDAYIPDQAKSLEERQERNNEIPKYDRRNFKYDQGQDEFTCPENKRLPLVEKGGKIKKYVCSDCLGCPVKAQCAKGNNRQICLNHKFEKYKSAMREKLNSQEGKNKYLERMSDVEPVFGNLIANQKAGNFLCRGKPMVKIEFGLSCIAHNLVKIANWIKNNHREGNNEIQLAALMRLPAAT